MSMELRREKSSNVAKMERTGEQPQMLTRLGGGQGTEFSTVSVHHSCSRCPDDLLHLWKQAWLLLRQFGADFVEVW